MTARTAVISLLCAASAAAQDPRSEFRAEKTVPAGRTVSAHNVNGNVTVTTSTSGKVEIVGVKKGSSRYFDDITLDVVEHPGGLTICAIFRERDDECDEDGLRSHSNRGRRNRDRDWDDLQIDIQLKVPKELSVSASSVSGDVSVVGAEGRVKAASVSGDVRMQRLRISSLRATSVSGDVDVGVDAFTGDGDLRFTSVSGNVTAELPKTIDADVRMTSVSGSLDSEFPLVLNGRMSRRSLEARIGKGGRQLDVTTVSGDVRLRTAK
jgi:DUF4097 and DUF4098 domain-containing protein YvlB